MSAQVLVSADQIENELSQIWKKLSAEAKTRASLFNLIVFSRLSKRTDYYRHVVQLIIQKFPCRVLFISSDPEHSYLKTSVSVVFPASGEESFACDQIDIGIGGDQWPRVPSILLPHLLPDLPTYLLWTEDPSENHPLFAPLSSFSSRIIFDSESSPSLLKFSETLLSLPLEVADLNFARMEGWRDLFSVVFDTEESLQTLRSFGQMEIFYNSRETESFCHLKIQAIYLIAWLTCRLKWQLLSVEPKENLFQFREGKILLKGEVWENLNPGVLIGVTVGKNYRLIRDKKTPHHIHFPEEGQTFILERPQFGLSLIKQIGSETGSQPFLQVLQTIRSSLVSLLC
jgi:hypothetical protein